MSVEDQLISVPFAPTVGKLRFCVTPAAESPGTKTTLSDAVSVSTDSLSLNAVSFSTFTLNSFVFCSPSLVIVAVSVTITSLAVFTGRFTVPFVAITVVSVEDQLISVPFAPATGKLRFCVTPAAESPGTKPTFSDAVSVSTDSLSVNVVSFNTFTLNVFVSCWLPLVTVAVNVTITSLAVFAGRVTVPSSAITVESVEDQLISVPFAPASGKLRFCVTPAAESPGTKTTLSDAVSVSTDSLSLNAVNFNTFTLNVFVSCSLPLVTVAVNVTITSLAVFAGRVTVPSAAITVGAVDDQLIVVPFAPVIGKLRFCVTLAAESPGTKPTFSDAVSASTDSIAVMDSLMTLITNSLVLNSPLNVNSAVNVTVVSPVK